MLSRIFFSFEVPHFLFGIYQGFTASAEGCPYKISLFDSLEDNIFFIVESFFFIFALLHFALDVFNQ
jgi:hypothetical protein